MSVGHLYFYPIVSNGRRYKIVGDCWLLSCPVTPNVMRDRKFE
jgi:hypothetical protein